MWWAVYTKSRQEKTLSRHLVTNRIPHYLPLVHKTYISCGRNTPRVPLFPGYVFMLGSEQETDVLLNIESRIEDPGSA